MTLFKYFEEYDGVMTIINVTLSAMKFWKNKESCQKWTQWVEELNTFTNLPLFFSSFIRRD